MSLLDELNDVRLVLVDDERRLAFAWFGGAGVNVYDEDGAEVHYFTMGGGSGRPPTLLKVKAAIERAIEDDEL